MAVVDVLSRFGLGPPRPSSTQATPGGGWPRAEAGALPETDAPPAPPTQRATANPTPHPADETTDETTDGSATDGRGPSGPLAGEPPARRGWRWLLAYPFWATVAIIGGIAVRVAYWLGAGSLNSDELWIAVSLQRRSFSEVPGPLDYDQLAPLGWLWLENAALAISRGDEMLRLPSLLAGCSVVALTAILARRLLPGPLALAATVLVAGGPGLIYQSSQVKQYSYEAAACCLLVALGLWAVSASDRRRPMLAFWAAGAVTVWFANTAIFVVVSVGTLIVFFAALDRRWSHVRRHVLVAVPAAVAVLTVYLMTPEPAEWLHRWWSRTYPGSLGPEQLSVQSVLDWSREFLNIFGETALMIESTRLRALVVALVAVGAVSLAIRLPRQAALICAPLAVAYVLSMLRLYPMATRVGLWLVPLAWVLACAGVDGLIRLGWRALSWALRWNALRRLGPLSVSGTPVLAAVLPAVAAILFVGAYVPQLGRVTHTPNADRYVRAEQALRYVAENRRPGDLVLVHQYKSTSALALWYGPGVGLRPDGEFVAGLGAQCRDPKEFVGLSDASRVWLLRVTWDSKTKAQTYVERTAMLSYGTLAEEVWYGGVMVLRYDAAPSAGSPPDLNGTPGDACLLARPLPPELS